MVKSDRKIVELSKVINSGDNAAIIESIAILRNEKPFEGAIGLLTALYDKSSDGEIRKTISEFMNDLKDQSVCHEVIAEIEKKWKHDTISMLISSCWQSGLDYSEFPMQLGQAFLKGDYVTAIECLTVIEESIVDISEDRKTELAELIKDNLFASGNEKSTLTSELLTILGR